MLRNTLFLLFFSISLIVNSQTIFGKLNSFDEETDEIESVIEIYKKDGKAFAKIIEIKDPERQDATCFKC